MYWLYRSLRSDNLNRNMYITIYIFACLYVKTNEKEKRCRWSVDGNEFWHCRSLTPTWEFKQMIWKHFPCPGDNRAFIFNFSIFFSFPTLCIDAKKSEAKKIYMTRKKEKQLQTISFPAKSNPLINYMSQMVNLELTWHGEIISEDLFIFDDFQIGRH